MRTWVSVLVAAVLGACMGYGATILELGASPKGNVAENFVNVASVNPANGNGPKAVAEDTDFQFGSLEYDAHSSHDFKVRNDGKEPLELVFDHVSCGLCTQAKIKDAKVMPGEETTIEVLWHANKEGVFQQSATIGTNDPHKPKLVFYITGKVMNTHRVDPGELVFTSIAVNDSQQADVKIYSYRAGPLEVLTHEMSDKETADKFEITTKPMPAEMLAQDADAKSGVLVQVAVKAGLPLGPIRQKMKLHLNLPGEPVVEVPITGNITSEVLLMGKGWDSERELLNLGVVSTKAGAKAELFLQFHGEKRRELHPTLGSVTPHDVLKVSLGEAQELAGGRLVRVPLTVEVPPGSRQATFLGGAEGKLGEIHLTLDEKTDEKMRIFVRFAVGE